MKNSLLRPIALLCFFTLLYPVVQAQQCTFQLDMFDDYGDGWNGGILTITNGSQTYVFSLNDFAGDGVDSTVTFSVNDGMPLSLSWLPGDFNYEVSFALYNNDGDLLFEVTDPTSGVVFQQNAVCVACLKPQNVLVDNIYDNRALVRWTPGVGTSVPVGWWVVYGPGGFPPGAGDTLYVATPKATIPGLQKKTVYDFYVQQDCGNGETGDLAGPFTFETYLSVDVGISAVLSPVSSCELGTETVTITMHNFGAKPLQLIPYNYSVNGIPAGVSMPQDGLYTHVLGKDAGVDIEFETTYNFSEPGEYLIAAWTEMAGDENPANDTVYYRVNNRLVVPYFQNFEAWDGGWYAEADTTTGLSSWAYGTPTGQVISAAASGLNAWVTNLAGLYQAGELSYLYSPCFDFADLTEDPVIEFALNHYTETDYDGCWLEMSFDDGANWLKVGTLNEGVNWYNHNNTFTGLGPVWAGSSNGWQTARHRLMGAGGENRVHLRFVFSSNDFAQLEGAGIDDVRVYVPKANDLAALSVVTQGDDLECGLENDQVIFRFANFGTLPQTVFAVGYSLNGAAPVVENIGPISLNPDKSLEYIFLQPFDSRDGAFKIRCWALLTGDENPANDSTAAYLVDHLPAPLPLQEDFENGQPENWITDAVVESGHNNSSQVLAVNLYNFNTLSITDLPRVGFVGPTDSLRFDYRITNFSGNGTIPTVLIGATKIEVQASTDCGATFQTLYTINSSNHTPSVNLQTIRVGLADYAGKGITIRLRSAWSSGDFYLDFDNFNIGSGSTPVRDIEALEQLSLYPNPTTGQTTLTATFNRAVNAQVQVLDLTGRIVWQTSGQEANQLAIELDLSRRPAGMYLVRLLADGQWVTRKLAVGY